MTIGSNLRQVEEAYNADHDVPDGVQVTWADYSLLVAVKELLSRMDHLETVVQRHLERSS
jgi:hypothetical protein